LLLELVVLVLAELGGLGARSGRVGGVVGGFLGRGSGGKLIFDVATFAHEKCDIP
jgi:hypothetical protein